MVEIEIDKERILKKEIERRDDWCEERWGKVKEGMNKGIEKNRVEENEERREEDEIGKRVEKKEMIGDF